MTGKQPQNMPASVHSRLKKIAQNNNEAFDLVLVRFALERLLYRLSKSPHHELFVVKGAIMFQVWSNLPHRPTRDLDLLGTGEPNSERFAGIFRQICAQTVEDDGLRFDDHSVQTSKMKENEDYEGIRVRFDAYLGPARIPIQVDIGFGDTITPALEVIAFPTMLELPPPKLRSYPRETVVAEKFQAMVQLGIANSRMKDFFDLFTLCNQFEFDGDLICQAIKATFDRRKTNIPASPPLPLTLEFTQDKLKSTQWNAFLTKSKLASKNLDLHTVTIRLCQFLMPPAEAANQATCFDKAWKPDHGWIEK